MTGELCIVEETESAEVQESSIETDLVGDI
jgi:hypothetical protein